MIGYPNFNIAYMPNVTLKLANFGQKREDINISLMLMGRKGLHSASPK